MAKQTHVNVGGTWRSVKSVWQNVNGVWKKDVMPKLNVSGVYKECMGYFTNRLFITGGYYSDSFVTEIDQDTGAEIDYGVFGGSDFDDVGGMKSRLFGVQNGTSGGFTEINPDTFVVLNSSSTERDGVGGMTNRLFSIDSYTLEERNPDDFVIIDSVATSQNVVSVGGIANRLFITGGHSSTNVHITEVNINNFSEINTSSPPEDYSSSVGGCADRLYWSNYQTRNLYEINVDTLASIRKVPLSSPSNGVYGVGGIFPTS